MRREIQIVFMSVRSLAVFLKTGVHITKKTILLQRLN